MYFTNLELRVSVVTRLRAGWSRVQNPIQERDFSPLQNVQTGSSAHPVSYSEGTGVLAGGEVDHPSPSTATVKNEWSCTSAPCMA
jgi:hypothetical protein